MENKHAIGKDLFSNLMQTEDRWEKGALVLVRASFVKAVKDMRD